MTDGDDKTQIKTSSAPLINHSDEDSDILELDTTEESGDRTLLATTVEQRHADAQKKAQALADRLAQMTEQMPNESVSNTDVGEQNPISVKSPSTDLEDVTRIAPNTQSNDRVAQQKKLPDIEEDSTVFASRAMDGSASSSIESNQSARAINSNDELLKERFVIESVLGAGGMGVVYKAKDLLKVEAQDRDPYVAIKVLGDEFKAHPEAFISLQRESRKTQSIAHPNIVNVHDFDRDGDTVFMTMEFLEGKPLDKLISQYRATGLPEEDAWKILEGISSALIYAHEQKIIHSDFKPGNIFVTKNGIAKVFDFGIARAVAKAEKFDDSEEDKTIFDAGGLGALTPAYASLEMLEGETPDIRDDIYALGCIAYEMFAGKHPFDKIHANEAERKKLKPKRIPNVTKRQWRAIEKSLSFRREDRCESVEAFWTQLTQKSNRLVIWVSATAVTMVMAGLLVYQNTLVTQGAVSYSEDEIRNEIEQRVLIEQNQDELVELLDTLEFTESWEKKLFQTYSDLIDLLGRSDTWLLERKADAVHAYVEKINTLILAEEFVSANLILINAKRYSDDEAKLAELQQRLDTEKQRVADRHIEEEKKKQLAAIQRQKDAQIARAKIKQKTEFDTAMETVNKQLACLSTPYMTDVDIAVKKLRSLDRVRYKKVEADIVAQLAQCIAKIGLKLPERAEETKKRALRTFPNNSVLARVKIEPKDPCDASLAGLGARGQRAVCRDILKSEGEIFGKGPAMVVIPSKGSVASFAIGRYEVTYADINGYCEYSGQCKVSDPSQKTLPATNLELQQIKQYLAWLSSKSKRAYRLPSNIEWMHAARANSDRQDSNRNCRLNSRGIKKGGQLIKASAGQQNDWGMVNHLGNAQELVLSRGALLAMGGSFETQMNECIVTRRVSHSGKADSQTGFRVLREIDKK